MQIVLQKLQKLVEQAVSKLLLQVKGRLFHSGICGEMVTSYELTLQMEQHNNRVLLCPLKAHWAAVYVHAPVAALVIFAVVSMSWKLSIAASTFLWTICHKHNNALPVCPSCYLDCSGQGWLVILKLLFQVRCLWHYGSLCFISGLHSGCCLGHIHYI